MRTKDGELPASFVTANELGGGGFKKVRLLGFTERDLLEYGQELSQQFVFIEKHRLSDPASRLSSRVYRLALEKSVDEAVKKAKKDPAHGPQVFKQAHDFISSSIERELRALARWELERDQVSDLPKRCERVAAESPVIWVAHEAKSLPAEFLDSLSVATRGVDVSEVDNSPIQTKDLLRLVKTVYSYLERVEELEWISDYDGPSFNESSKKLARANEMAHYISARPGRLKQNVQELSEELGVSEETVKKTLRELAYASFDGFEDVLEVSIDDRFELDMRKTPKSSNEDIRKFYYAVRAKQVLDPVACKALARELVKYPQPNDYEDLIESYSPLSREQSSLVAPELISLMKKIADVKAEAMQAHPVRAASWFKQLKGRVTEWEKEQISKAPEEEHPRLRRTQLEYDLLYYKAVFEFVQQAAELRDFVKIYGKGLDPEFKRLLAQLLGRDPLKDELMVEDPEKLERYLSSLDKTLDRWNDLSKEFRKVPYNLERALKKQYGGVPAAGELAFTSVESELAQNLTYLHDNYEEAHALFVAVKAARADIEKRLKSIAEHTVKGREFYTKAMRMREARLYPYLPTKGQLKAA